MKTRINKVFLLGTAALMTACSSTDLYDADSIEQQTKADYAANFAKKYPNVDMNQSWDYSSKQPYYSLPGSNGNKVTTRATENPFTVSDWYEVDNNTLNWMKEELVEGKNNSAKGKAFYMTVPDNDFTIVPIYQGQAGSSYCLHVVVDGKDYKIWDKSQNIQVGKKQQGNISWTDLVGDDNTMNVDAVRSKEIKFSGLTPGAKMYFELEITRGLGGYNKTGTKQSSMNHMMLALQDVPRPNNISEEKEVMIVGCEAANLEKSDWDYNDMVLLVYGSPEMPKPEEIKEGDPVETVTTVRYMIEDLGATDDFDFNDIVIDVSNIETKTPVYTNGKLSWKDVSIRQEAVVRHLGGTLPFKLKIGDTEIPEMGGKSTFQTSPDTKYDITGWNMNSHNIKVEVRQMGNDKVYNNVVFPKAGEAPMIIAVDPDQEWMAERTMVPENWFYVPQQ